MVQEDGEFGAVNKWSEQPIKGVIVGLIGCVNGLRVEFLD
jgi:ABC-type transporter Mla maintaining outer membrane lipid asymmetry permease subunit MlaE